MRGKRYEYIPHNQKENPRPRAILSARPREGKSFRRAGLSYARNSTWLVENAKPEPSNVADRGRRQRLALAFLGVSRTPIPWMRRRIAPDESDLS